MNILVVSTGSGLFKPLTGDRSRFFNLAYHLSTRNKITVLQPVNVKDINDSSLGDVTYFKTSLFGKTFAALTDLNPNFLMKFSKIILDNKIDIIQISHPAGIILSKIVSQLLRKDIPVIYDAHNVDGDSVQSGMYHFKSSEISLIKKIIIKLYITLIPLVEMFALKFCDYVISVSEEDKSRFVQKYNVNCQKIHVIPSGADIRPLNLFKESNQYLKLKQKNKILILFHGSFTNASNIEAINLIRDYIAPKFVHINDVIFLIAGTGVPDFRNQNLISLGYVEDIYSLIDCVDIAIVPLRGGGGTKLKILDYMSARLPIITTKKGIEGIKAKNYKDVLIVNDVNDEFIDAINYLINNEEERKKLGINARILAEEKYDWSKIGKNLNELYKTILKEKDYADK